MARPVPKPQHERRNRNPKQKGDWVELPREGYQGPIPSCAGFGLGKAAQKWWRTVWRSPMATQWTEEDIPALLELAILREALMDGKISVASEVRLRTDQFGLTPKGRQDRRWMITDEDLERAGFQKKKASVTRLRAVDPSLIQR